MYLARVFNQYLFQKKQTVHSVKQVYVKYRYSKLGFCVRSSTTECRKIAYQLLSNIQIKKFYDRFINYRFYSETMCDRKEIKSEGKKPFERLPKNVIPSHYDLFLKPDLEKFIFEGSVNVDVEVS